MVAFFVSYPFLIQNIYSVVKFLSARGSWCSFMRTTGPMVHMNATGEGERIMVLVYWYCFHTVLNAQLGHNSLHGNIVNRGLDKLCNAHRLTLN